MADFDVAEAGRVVEVTVGAWVRAMGCVVEAVSVEAVTLRLPFTEALASADGRLSAPALSACADLAMTLAIGAASGGYRAVRVLDHTLNYVTPVDRQDVVFIARVVRLGKSVAFTTVEMRLGESGAAAGFASGTYAFS